MAEQEGQVIVVENVDSWNDHFQKGKDSNKLVVVDFTASWCGPCRFISPIFADLAKKMPHVIFLKVDVDELSSVAEKWSIEAMPTFLFLKEGELVEKVVGADKDKLILTVEKHAAPVTVA
ncbi:hypothetical protein V8G54_036831 [Vigna mungo]|uniref:Thioredoxin domain-containing protein n=1 Tax=Vigna mungo TaxID=3915 RepID=A0AAQ3RFZ4_VIGMU